METPQPEEKAERKKRPIPTVSTSLADGTLAEMVYGPEERTTAFACFTDGAFRLEPSLTSDSGEKLVPYGPENNLLAHEVVLLPSEPAEYGSENELVCDVRAFIHRYVDLAPLFEEVAAYYVLFTWIYDAFNEVPYLRVRGDYGSGKSRFLLAVGSLCYKPIFASGASTVSPIFRILDSFRGTLIVDEADFKASDERAEIVKILNNGNARGFPVLRSEVTPKKEINPTAYTVFGPKLIATRGFFEDRALESRCLTEEMGGRPLRQDIPVNLPARMKDEAREIRNKLLLFRFRNLRKERDLAEVVDRSVEPRLSQIFAPLLATIEDGRARADLRELGRRYQREITSDRGFDMEAQLLEVIRDARASTPGHLAVKDVTAWFADRFGDDYDRKVTPKWIGAAIRKKLNLKPQKSNGVFILPPSEFPKLGRLYEKYGIEAEANAVDVGDIGDVSEDEGLAPAMQESARPPAAHAPGDVPEVPNVP